MKVNKYTCVKTGLQTEKGPFLVKGKEYYYALGRLIPVGNFIESGYVISEELVENINFLTFTEVVEIESVYGDIDQVGDSTNEEFERLLDFLVSSHETYKLNVIEANALIDRLVDFTESQSSSELQDLYSSMNTRLKTGIGEEVFNV